MASSTQHSIPVVISREPETHFDAFISALDGSRVSKVVLKGALNFKFYERIFIQQLFQAQTQSTWRSI